MLAIRVRIHPTGGLHMCYGPDARPPFPPVSGGSGTGRELVLTASDGNRFAAFSAISDQAGAPGIVVLPDVRGLHTFYQELALRFAETGTHATAIDYFGRTAGIGDRSDDFEFMPHVMQTKADTVTLDVAAAVAHLRSKDGGEATSIFTVGFCFGGRASFNQAGRELGLAGVIGFYGRVGEREPGDSEAPVLQAKGYECPVLGLFGGDDGSIPPQDVAAFREALDTNDIKNELVTYEGAPHSFFDRGAEYYQKECDDAWTRILAFIKANA